MDDAENLIEIRDLYTNFYTYQGIVKALDGVTLSVRKGETLGLVGETGCGKSVTANCILRLIPSPPGKIESGRILFLMPPESKEKAIELERRIGELVERNASASEVAQLRKELDAVLSQYDLLRRSENYMRSIRGKYISMIFQEPMTALNPVFTAGDQIAEIIVLHERQELAIAVLKQMDASLKDIGGFQQVTRVKGEKEGEWKCSSCSATVMEDTSTCPQCGSSFDSRPLRKLEKARLNFYRRFYVTMAKNPKALSLRIAAKVPILRRYLKPLRKESLHRAERMLRLVRIPDPKNVVNAYPHELSGGMQQRVMIAMALACRPLMLIADEPTTALDVTIQAQILKLMKDLQAETGTSILMITHNLGVVAETCDRVGVMYAGTMAEVGEVRTIFKEPLHPYTQGLLNSIPRLNASVTRLETIEGSVPNLVKPPPGCRFNPRCPYAMAICREKKPPMIEVAPGHLVACHLYGGAAK